VDIDGRRIRGPSRARRDHPTRPEVPITVRKLITMLLAACALALPAIALTSATHPADAQAAGCQRWRLPSDNYLRQSNGWTTRVVYYYSPYNQWYAVASKPGYYNMVSSAVYFTNWGADLVRIHIVWNNGAEGIYTGTIDAGGHVTGTTVDRFRPQNRAYWDMGYVSCAQY
jgi:hypothetical protein